MSDDWVSFHGKPYGRPGNFGIRVTVNPRYVMYLNRQAFAALGEPQAVEFLFHDRTNTIGMRSVDPRKEYAFEVKRKNFANGPHYGYVIHAGAFFTDTKVRPARTIQFNKITVDAKGMMHLPLPFISAIGPGAR